MTIVAGNDRGEAVAQDISADGQFSEFFRAESEDLYRLAFVILGAREIAEDVTQDALGAVYRSWHTLDEPSRFARRVLVNRCRDVMRRSGTERAYQRRHVIRETATPPEPDFAAMLLAPLRPRERVSLVLRTHLQMTDKEIAEMTGWPLGTVKTSIRRGLITLRSAIDDD